jgi:hypothetical protein
MDKNYTKETIEEELNKPLLVVSERSWSRLLFLNFPIFIGGIVFAFALIHVIDNIFIDVILYAVVFFYALDFIFSILWKEIIVYKDKLIIKRFLVSDYIENIYKVQAVYEDVTPMITIILGVCFYTENKFYTSPKTNNFIYEMTHNKFCGQAYAVGSEDREKIKEIFKKKFNVGELGW